MTPAAVGRALVAAPWWEWRAPLVCIDADGMRWLVYEGSGGLLSDQPIFPLRDQPMIQDQRRPDGSERYEGATLAEAAGRALLAGRGGA